MNAIGSQLVWCIIQVTLVCLIAIVLSGLLRRRGGALPTHIAPAALSLVLILTVFALSPWPRWSAGESSVVAVVPAVVSTPPPRSSAISAVGVESSGTPLPPPEATLWSRIRLQFGRAGESVGTAAQALSIFALPLVLVSILVGATRYVIGWQVMRRLRKAARPIDDAQCLQVLQQVRHDLGLDRSVAVAVSEPLASPATIGWRKPLILLPADWAGWSDEELRAVLAHELAHIRSHDFVQLAAAQLNTVFHFYHPLIHRLLDQLRMEQELAADATAADVAGGPQTYMTALAALALRCDTHPVAWPARPFLPDSGTFLRRIEMLKDRTPARHGQLLAGRLLPVALIVGAGLVAIGLRPGQAADKPQPLSDDDRAAAVEESMNNTKSLGLALHNYYSDHGHLPPATIVGENGVTHSWRVALLPYVGGRTLYEQYRRDEPWDSEHNKQFLKRIPESYRSPLDEETSASSSYFVLTGKGTPFDGGEEVRFQNFTDGTSATLLVVESKQDTPWTKPVDIEYDSGKRPELGGWYDDGFVAVLADGSAHFITAEISDATLHHLIQLADGEVIDPQELHRKR